MRRVSLDRSTCRRGSPARGGRSVSCETYTLHGVLSVTSDYNLVSWSPVQATVSNYNVTVMMYDDVLRVYLAATDCDTLVVGDEGLGVPVILAVSYRCNKFAVA